MARMSAEERAERQRLYNRRHYEKRKAKAREQGQGDTRKVLLSGRLPEWMVARVHRIALEGVATGKYPCKTTGEAMAWLFTIAFKRMVDDPEVGAMMQFAEADHVISNIERERKETTMLFHKASEAVANLLRIEEHDAALCYFDTAVKAMISLQETVWSRDAVRKFRRKFPELSILQRKGKVPAANLMGSVERRRLMAAREKLEREGSSEVVD